MKIITIILICFLSFNLNLYCQDANDINVRINCIIFIDARIPASTLVGHFEYTDTLNQRQKINFYYITGDIVCEKKEFSKFNLNPPLGNEVIMYLNHKDFTEGNNNIADRQYKIHLDYNLMFSTIVLTIANVDKKKGTYVYDIDISHISGLSNQHKALKKSRQLKESYWIRKAEYKRTHNIFQRMWNTIRGWW